MVQAQVRTQIDSRVPHAPATVRNQPLDGLRGLGTIFVLIGHLGIVSQWWPSLAGVLAVSMFFTLSGYLITTGLLRSLEREGRVRFGRFYARRVRRLLPAATVSVAFVSVAWWITGRPLPMVDVVSSLTYWRNWQLVAEGQGYGAIFNEASPLQHFWSLSIEEQFYILLPASLVGLMWLGAGRTRLALAAFSGAMVACFWLGGVFDTVDRSRAYYGTDSRAAEFLAGVVLAIVLAEPHARRRVHHWLTTRAGVIAVNNLWLVQVVLWWRVGFYADRLFPLLVVVNAVCSVVLISAFVTTDQVSVARWVLSWKPISELGRMSYSVYLLHWPIYLLLDDPGPATWSEAAWKLAIALAAGVALFVVVEDAVQRSARWRTPRRLSLGLAAASVVAVAAIVAPGAGRNAPLVDVAAIERSRDSFFADLGIGPSPAVTPTPDALEGGSATAVVAGADTVPIGVERVLLVGDSNGFTSSIWLDRHPEELPWQFKFWSGTNCGTTSGAGRVWNMGKVETDVCPTWLDELRAAVVAYDPDVVLVVSMGLDLQQHDLGDGVWRSLGDPLYDAWLAGKQQDFVDLLAATGARVGWFVQVPYQVPDRETGKVRDGDGWYINRLESIDRMNELLVDLARRDPRVVLVPFDQYAASWPGGPLDTDFRPDGAHLDGSRADVAAWIMSQVELVASGELALP